MTDTIAPASRLTGRTVRRDALSPQQEERLHDLLATFFNGVDRATFIADLHEKSHVILLEDVRPMSFPAFDEVKPQLQQRLQAQWLDKYFKDLRAKNGV